MKEIQLNSVVELKPTLINGESPEMDNPLQAGESCAVATTERVGLLKRVSDSLNTAYNLFMKVVSVVEMSTPIPIYN